MLMILFVFSILRKMPYHFDFLNSRHPNIKFTIEKETNQMLSFLDFCVHNKEPSCLLTLLHRKNTFTGLLTNIFSFTSCSYKIGLIHTLVDRGYRSNNTLLKFNDDVTKLYFVFKKNQYPEYLISRVVNLYLGNAHSSKTSTSSTDITTTYVKLPYLKLSNFTQGKVRMLVNIYCNSIKIKLAFSSFKAKNLILVKDYVPRSLRSYVVYKFKCAGCNSMFIGETSQHVSTRV